MKKKFYSFGQWLIDNLGNDSIEKYWSDKNDRSPFDVSYGSNSKKVWIKCYTGIHPDYDIMPNNFTRGDRCPVCSNHKCISGINDIATTHPQYVKYFADINDTLNHTAGSSDRVLFQCDVCGFNKEMTIADFFHYGFSCPLCSDGISYPNRFMASILHKINVAFKPEYIIKPRRYQYDFYIASHNMIIEMHGKQHYAENVFSHKGKTRTLEEERKNDLLKYDWAIQNGVEHYVVIDCSRSTKDFIYNNIMESELSVLFDLSGIDCNEIAEMSSTNLIKQVCDLWNSGINDMKELSIKFNVCKDTIRAWLKRGSSIGLCTYNR